MSRREPLYLLEDILTSMAKVERYIAGMKQVEFLADEKTTDAVVRNIEIIGEAARQLPDSLLTKHVHIPWRDIAGLRNRIVHEYFGVDLEIIWTIIEQDLPMLKTQIQDICDELTENLDDGKH